jgi:hypothetical protein
VEQGTKNDLQKLQWHQLPLTAIEAIIEVYMVGAKKYGIDNWKKGFQYSRIYDATLRHLTSFWKGQDKDEETGLYHLAQAAWNVITLLWMSINNKGIDDR